MQSLVLLILAIAMAQFAVQAHIVMPAQDSSSQTIRPSGHCQLNNQGLVTLNVDFISYHNPSDSGVTGRPCDPDSSCDVFFDICVSIVNSSDCELLSAVTEVITNKTVISFGRHLGGLTNPISVTISASSLEGVKIDVSVWDEDPRSRLNDLIDDFSIEYTGEPGSYPEVILARGNRQPPKSTLYMIARLFCPDPITTPTTPTPTTATPTTATPTTPRPTSESDLEKACRTALVFNESVRRLRSGLYYGPNLARNRYVSDLVTLHNYTNTTGNYPWFKFKGMAGSRLLSTTCSTSGYSYIGYRQCGTLNPIYVPTHPTITHVVGVTYQFDAYARTQTSCTGGRFLMNVMLCPNNDLVYRYIGSYAFANYGFCSTYY